MKNKLTVIAGIIIIVFNLVCLYSYAVISDSGGTFKEIKQRFYVKENRVNANLRLSKDSYLLLVKHKPGQEQNRDIIFNGHKLNTYIWPNRSTKGDIETTYIHLPRDTVREGKNTINIAFIDNPPCDVEIRFINYRKQIIEQIYILFSDSAHLPIGTGFFKIHPFCVLTFLVRGVCCFRCLFYYCFLWPA
jgi:hypothetical protein